jgi:hypothetical protein
MLCDRLGVSERWVCRVVGQYRSTQRQSKRAEDDAALRAELRKFSVERPPWGYRRAHHRLRELGREINRKRVQRLWREDGLRVPVRKRKRRRLGTRRSRLSGCVPSDPTTCGVRLPVAATVALIIAAHVLESKPTVTQFTKRLAVDRGQLGSTNISTDSSILLLQ